MNKKGFTLIEVLITLSIITILSTIVSVSAMQYREKSKIAKAAADIKKIHGSINLLYNDTGKLPKGCLIGITKDAETCLNTKDAGLLERPEVKDYGFYCEWTADDLSGWSGPYFQTTGSNRESLIDPWGNEYYVDYDYYGYQGYPAGSESKDSDCISSVETSNTGCSSKLSNGVAIVSAGPDEIQYNCDDIVEYIHDCGSLSLTDCLNEN